MGSVDDEDLPCLGHEGTSKQRRDNEDDRYVENYEVCTVLCKEGRQDALLEDEEAEAVVRREDAILHLVDLTCILCFTREGLHQLPVVSRDVAGVISIAVVGQIKAGINCGITDLQVRGLR